MEFRAVIPNAPKAPALQICTVFNCVPLSTVISQYGLHLIALYIQSNVEVTIKYSKSALQLFNCTWSSH